jgi:hypothetical protein
VQRFTASKKRGLPSLGGAARLMKPTSELVWDKGAWPIIQAAMAETTMKCSAAV